MVLDRNDFWQIQVVSSTKKEFGHFQIGLLAPCSFFFADVNSCAFLLFCMLCWIRLDAILDQYSIISVPIFIFSFFNVFFIPCLGNSTPRLLVFSVTYRDSLSTTWPRCIDLLRIQGGRARATQSAWSLVCLRPLRRRAGFARRFEAVLGAQGENLDSISPDDITLCVVSLILPSLLLQSPSSTSPLSLSSMLLLVFVFTGISDVATVLGSHILVRFRFFLFRPFEPRFLEIGLWPAPKSTVLLGS